MMKPKRSELVICKLGKFMVDFYDGYTEVRKYDRIAGYYTLHTGLSRHQESTIKGMARKQTKERKFQ